jgi:hypothetical protein
MALVLPATLHSDSMNVALSHVTAADSILANQWSASFEMPTTADSYFHTPAVRKVPARLEHPLQGFQQGLCVSFRHNGIHTGRRIMSGNFATNNQDDA